MLYLSIVIIAISFIKNQLFGFGVYDFYNKRSIADTVAENREWNTTRNS